MNLTVSRKLSLSTSFGPVRVQHFRADEQEGVIILPNGDLATPTPVRIHSSCLFSEALMSPDCDCAAQLHRSMEIVVNESGLVIYQYQEGRGAGLANKIAAMGLQVDTGCDTASAYRALGLTPDPRDHLAAVEVLKATVGSQHPIIVLTNNPGKMEALTRAGLNVAGRRSLVVRKNQVISDYLNEKRSVLGHILDP